MQHDDLSTRVTTLVRSALGLDDSFRLDASTPLLGAMPEVDSMTLVTMLTALEQEFGFVIEDDEVDAALFASVGSLIDFVAAKAN